MLTLFFIFLVLILVSLPIWPYSKTWGPRVSVAFGIIAIIFLFFLVRSITYLEYETDEEGVDIEIETTSGR